MDPNLLCTVTRDCLWAPGHIVSHCPVTLLANVNFVVLSSVKSQVGNGTGWVGCDNGWYNGMTSCQQSNEEIMLRSLMILLALSCHTHYCQLKPNWNYFGSAFVWESVESDWTINFRLCFVNPSNFYRITVKLTFMKYIWYLHVMCNVGNNPDLTTRLHQKTSSKTNPWHPPLVKIVHAIISVRRYLGCQVEGKIALNCQLRLEEVGENPL